MKLTWEMSFDDWRRYYALIQQFRQARARGDQVQAESIDAEFRSLPGYCTAYGTLFDDPRAGEPVVPVPRRERIMSVNPIRRV